MTISELRQFKQNLLDKYIKSKDKDVKTMMKTIDKIIKRKIENEE